MADIDGLKQALAGLKIEDNPAVVRQKSRDFFWYSPVLKQRLEHVTGDFVVSPRTEVEVIRALAEAYAHDVPVTVRGAGTGNYGQAMPLSGGLVLNLADMRAIGAIDLGTVTAEAGAIMADIDAATTAHSRQELRLHPSTHRSATIGGFIAGGSGGIGSIRWGGLRDLGNILSARVVTMEANPRVLEMSGDELSKIAHAYGTNGVITAVEMPLAPAYDWVDVLIGFDDFLDAAAFADDLGSEDGILIKELGVVAAPAPHDYFLRHQRYIGRDQSVVIVLIARQVLPALETLVARDPRATILFRSDRASDDERRALPPGYELTWNHTTLRGLRVDPTITYLQTLYPYPNQLERVAATVARFGHELMQHLEFVRFDGNVTCFGLPMLRFTSEERLDEVIRIHEDLGCPVFNPHRYTLEEGGMKRSDPVQLSFKREADPKGLLNPGKMIAWDQPDYDFGVDKLYLFPGMRTVEA